MEDTHIEAAFQALLSRAAPASAWVNSQMVKTTTDIDRTVALKWNQRQSLSRLQRYSYVAGARESLCMVVTVEQAATIACCPITPYCTCKKGSMLANDAGNGRMVSVSFHI